MVGYSIPKSLRTGGVSIKILKRNKEYRTVEKKEEEG
jgi:hypothetical protein